ncbi:unnamed protein product [Periconia digitata]|uniref:Uncharacterized protein n=1 Tax=Periconia digitata TaxID=1303443 RepID=A0A9W4URD1_9PLEO|nr:unnamed protein product [Periconia digitata]
MKPLQIAVVAVQAAFVLASPDIIRRADNDVADKNAVTTTTLFSTSYFTVTKCAPDVTECPAEATTVYTSVVPVTTTTTICLVTSTPGVGMPSAPEQTSPGQGGPTTPVPGVPSQIISSGPAISSQTSPTGSFYPPSQSTSFGPGAPGQASSSHGTTPLSYVPGVPSQSSGSGLGSLAPTGPLTTSTTPRLSASSPYLPSSIVGTYYTESEGVIVSSQPSPSASSGYASSQPSAITGGTLTSPGSSLNGYDHPSQSSTSIHLSNSTPFRSSNTNTEGMFTSLPVPPIYGVPSADTTSSAQFTNATLTYPLSSRSASYASSGYAVPPNDTFATTQTGNPPYSSFIWPTSGPTGLPEHTTTTHVVIVPSNPGMTASTLPVYNGTVPPVSSNILSTATSVPGGPSGSASGYPSPSGGNSSFTPPKPPYSAVPLNPNPNEGQPIIGAGKSSIVAIVVAFAFAHLA